MIRVLVVCEAEADRRTGCELAERVVLERTPWADGLLDAQLAWAGHEPSACFLPWRSVKHAYTRANLPQFPPRQPAGPREHLPDFVVARKAILLARALKFDAVVLLRDADKQPERRDGMEAARQAAIWPPCVLGVAVAKREAWVLNGFIPGDGEEKEALKQARKALGFDPTTTPEQLDASLVGALRDAKRVLSLLTQDDFDREAQCWCVTPLEVLREKGEGSGLAAYLTEVAERLAPLLGTGPRA